MPAVFLCNQYTPQPIKEDQNATNVVSATGADGASVAITVNGSVHTSGQSATWNTGTNTVNVVVTKSGYTTTTYTITVTKEE